MMYSIKILELVKGSGVFNIFLSRKFFIHERHEKHEIFHSIFRVIRG